MSNDYKALLAKNAELEKNQLVLEQQAQDAEARATQLNERANATEAANEDLRTRLTRTETKLTTTTEAYQTLSKENAKNYGDARANREKVNTKKAELALIGGIEQILEDNNNHNQELRKQAVGAITEALAKYDPSVDVEALGDKLIEYIQGIYQAPEPADPAEFGKQILKYVTDKMDMLKAPAPAEPVEVVKEQHVFFIPFPTNGQTAEEMLTEYHVQQANKKLNSISE